jgi:hypothetical protein
VLVVPAVLAGGVWVARYDPLTRGSIGWAPPKNIAVKVVDVSWALPDAPRIFKIDATAGVAFRYRFSIANEGPVPVRIEDVGTSDEHSAPMIPRRPVRVMLDPYATPDGTPWISFRPFTLSPGQEAAIEMQVDVSHPCYAAGTSASWSSEDMTYSVFGITRHAVFATNVEIVLTFPKDTFAGPSCPPR